MSKFTITLTDRPPVQIEKDDWPIVAGAKSWDGEYEFQANRKWKLFVRQHEDGRCLVYGIKETSFRNEVERRGGKVIDDISEAPLAIRNVADRLSFPVSLADDCIASLPAETI